MTTFNKKKEEEQALKDVTARETALKQLSRTESSLHAKIYNAEHGKFHSSRIEMVDASVLTNDITPPYDMGPPSSYGYSPSPSPECNAARLLALKLFQRRAQWPGFAEEY